MIHKFVSHNVSPLETHSNTWLYQTHAKLERRETPTRQDKDGLVFLGGDSYDYCARHMGYAYDFREWLNTYHVETQYYGILKVYAFDKTAIRNSGKVQGILEIHEIKRAQK
jgi:hypothetical protein